MEKKVLTSLHDLYLYDDIRRLLMNDGNMICLTKDNAPMNRRQLKVHKGLDNTLKFRIFDPDRNPVNVCNHRLYARIINAENQELMLEKACRTNTGKGMVFLDLNEGDLANFAPGHYDMIMIAQKDFVPGVIGESTTTAIYTDTDANVVATLHVTQQAERAPRPTYEITDDQWTPTQYLENGSGPMISQFYSSTIPGNRVQNHTNGTHSFSVYTDEDNKYTGTLTILGTLDLNPQEDPNSQSWFKIQTLPGTEDVEFVDFFGTEAFAFSANVMFLKFVFTPSNEVQEPGKIKKLLVRS